MQTFVDGLTASNRRLRFHGAVAKCSPALAARLVSTDGVRQVAWLAWLPTQAPGAADTLVGEARYVIDADDCRQAELAIAVAEAHHGLGVADALLQHLVTSARRVGVRRLFGDVLEDNLRMRAFMQRHGFAVDPFGRGVEGLRLERELMFGSRWGDSLGRAWWQACRSGQGSARTNLKVRYRRE